MEPIRRMAAEGSQRPESEQIKLHAERFRFLKRRWTGKAEDGTEFDFDLESRLKIGCVIHQTSNTDYVIVQKPETVYRVATPTDEMAALVGWKIGNLHFPIQIVDGAILVMIDEWVRTLLDREKWAYEEVSVVFQPLKLPPEALIPPPAAAESKS